MTLKSPPGPLRTTWPAQAIRAFITATAGTAVRRNLSWSGRCHDQRRHPEALIAEISGQETARRYDVLLTPASSICSPWRGCATMENKAIRHPLGQALRGLSI